MSNGVCQRDKSQISGQKGLIVIMQNTAGKRRMQYVVLW